MSIAAYLNNTPGGMWWLLGGMFLFGFLLPFAAAQSVLKIWNSLHPKSEIHTQIALGFWQQVGLGWLVLIPVYVFSYYYINLKLH